MKLFLAVLSLAAAEISQEQCRTGVLRKHRAPEQQAWCCALYGLCNTTTVGRRLLGAQAVIQVGADIYDCNEGLDNVRLYWDVEKQAHCCAELGMGCPLHAFDCESGYMNWVHGWSPGKKIWCCQNTNRGCPPTTMTTTTTATTTETSTFPGCMMHCTLENVKVTCEERIHFASVHTFLGEVSPCQMAHDLVLRECGGVCDHCPIRAACLGAANVPTSTPKPTTLPRTTLKSGSSEGKDPFDCQEGLEMWQMVWFPAKQEWCCNHKQLGCPDRALQQWQRPAARLAAPLMHGPRLAAWGALAMAAVVTAVAAMAALRRRVGSEEEMELALLD